MALRPTKQGGKKLGPRTILELGPAGLGNVFKHLDPEFKAKTLALVCKTFAKLLAEPDKEAGGGVWGELTPLQLPTELDDANTLVRWLTQRRDGISRLGIWGGSMSLFYVLSGVADFVASLHIGCGPYSNEIITILTAPVPGHGGSPFTNLQRLILSDVANDLTPQQIDKLTLLPALKSLDFFKLSPEGFTITPFSVSHLTSLTHLGLHIRSLASANPSATVPSGPWRQTLSALPALLSFRMEGRDANFGSDVLSRLHTLQNMVCRTAALPLDWQDLTGLTALNLSHTALGGVPGGNKRWFGSPTFHWPGLVHLKLSRCSISSLPGDFGNLSGLAILELNGNDLRDVPPELATLTRLRVLDMSDQQDTVSLVQPLDPFLGLTRLEKAVLLQRNGPVLSWDPFSVFQIGRFQRDWGKLGRNSPFWFGVDEVDPAPWIRTDVGRMDFAVIKELQKPPPAE